MTLSVCQPVNQNGNIYSIARVIFKMLIICDLTNRINRYVHNLKEISTVVILSMCEFAGNRACGQRDIDGTLAFVRPCVRLKFLVKVCLYAIKCLGGRGMRTAAIYM